MNTLRHYFSTAKYMMKMELMAQMEYPTFLVGWFLSNLLQFSIGIGTLWVVIVQFESINGWTFNQIAFMYGIGIISHALTVILAIQHWYIEFFVIHGEFDRMLLRPLDVHYQFITCNLNLIGLTDMLPGLIIFFYGAFAVGFSFSASNILLLLCVVVGATFLRSGIYAITGSIAFWTKKSYGLIEVTTGLFDRVVMYPLTIFNGLIQNVFTFLLPIGFISFFPASYFLEMDSGVNKVGVAPLWTLAAGIIFFSLGTLVFRMGMRHYDSAGN